MPTVDSSPSGPAEAGPSDSRPKLRVHFVTEDDPLYVIRFFETFFDEYPRDEVEVVGMTVQAAFNESRLRTARRVLALYGPTGFARLLARVALRRLQRRSIAALAQREGVLLVPTVSVNDADFVRRIRALRPDVIASVAAPEVFRSELLASARLRCVNIHSGRLPEYRGMLPTFWQMLFGERHATVTIHEMAPTLDAGDVLATLECRIEERDSLDRVMTETKREGARLAIRVLRELSAGTAVARPLDMTKASYHSFPKREDARAFRSLGHSLL